MECLRQLVRNSMDAIVKRVNSVAVLTKELQLRELIKKVARHVYLNHSDVAVMVLHQLTDRIMKDVALSLDLVAAQIIRMKLVDRISKIVDANILPMDVVQIIKHRLEAETMKVVVASMLLMVVV